MGCHYRFRLTDLGSDGEDKLMFRLVLPKERALFAGAAVVAMQRDADVFHVFQIVHFVVEHFVLHFCAPFELR